ncbi:MAG: polysaccharide ABC transporter ATP-binding protein [Planctomycetota bacterium]
MAQTVIDCQNIKKRYRLGQTASPDTLRDALSGVLRRGGRSGSDAASADTPTPGNDRDFWALKGVSFKVERGECLGIIGHNGAGKSTLLKVLARITEPTAGRIEMHGRVAALLEVGTGFHPELTGLENTYLNGSILGMTRKEVKAKLADIVEFAGTSKFMDTPVKRYSSGMRVRLGFAVAAHLDPEILIIDEVLAVGDVSFQKRCLGRMKDQIDAGRAVIFVSHQMPFVSKLCNRVAVMDHGQLVSTGNPSGMIKRYLELQYQGESPLDQPNDADDPDLVLRSASLNDTALPGELSLPMGSPLDARFTFGRPDESYPGFRCGLHFSTTEGVKVLSYLLATELKELPDQEGRFEVRCRVPRLPLTSGRYEVSIGARDNTRVLLMPRSFGAVEVIPEDSSTPGIIPRYGTHGYFVDHAEWQLGATVR